MSAVGPDSQGDGARDSSGRRFRCELCGDEVIVLPRANDRVLAEFYARSFPTAELPAGDRWAFARHRGVYSIDGLLRPPADCLVSHPCAHG